MFHRTVAPGSKMYLKIWKLLVLCAFIACIIYKSSKTVDSYTAQFYEVKTSTLIKKSESRCPPHFFKVREMTECHKWIECDAIEKILPELRRYQVIGQGYSKKFIGHCKKPNKTIFLTEDCSKYGSLDKFVQSQKILEFTAMQRLNIVIQLIECFVYLHHESGPPKVHCDLHNPMQALRQFLLRDDKRVVLGDLDEIPIDDPKNNKIAKCLAEVRCGMSNSKFLAPEQRYTKEECRSEAKFEKTATIKSDTWKIPEISNVILNHSFPNDHVSNELQKIKKELVSIHKNCKFVNASERADSIWVLNEYRTVFNQLKDENL